MVVKKIKIDKEAISEILVADTFRITEASDVEYELDETEENSSSSR